MLKHGIDDDVILAFIQYLYGWLNSADILLDALL